MPFPYHLKLTDGATTYELAVAQNPDTGELAWKEEELPFLLPRIGQGIASYVNRDPETEQVEEYRTWHGGFGQRRHVDSYYRASSGVDARFANILAPAPKFNTNIWYVIENGDAEEASASYNAWNAVTAGDTVTRDTTTSNTGSASWKLATSQSGAAAGGYITIANPTAWRGSTITLRGFIKRNSAVAASVNLFIQDSAAKSSGSAVTATTFTETSVARTIDAGATFVRFGIESATSATGTHGYVDDLFILIGNSTTYAAVEFAGSLYAAVGNTVSKYNTGTRTFDVVLIAGGAVTSLEAHNGTLYAAITGAAYQYSTTGAAGSWTASNRGADAQQADFFVSVGGTAQKTLWKALKPNKLASSNDGTNGSTAWATYTVGGSDRNIEGLFAYQNSPVVGRDDGLWVWDSANDDFDDVTPEFRRDPATTNFAAGLAHKSWLYLSTSHQGVFRYRTDGQGHFVEELSQAFAPSGLTDFGGRIKSFAEGNRFLYCLVDTPQASSATRTTHVISFEEAGNAQYVHTLKDITSTNVYYGYSYNSTLYIFTDVLPGSGANNAVRIQAVDLPPHTHIPFQDNQLSLETSGTIDFSEWDGGFLSETKLLLSWEFYGENINANNYWTLKYKRLGESSWTSVGNFNSLSNGSQILRAKTQIATASNRASKTWQWQLSYTYDGTSSPPLCTGLVVKAVVRYTNTQRAFAFSLDLDTPTMAMPDGTFQPLVPRTVYEQLRTWEDTATPVTLTINDASTAYDVLLRPVHLRSLMVAADGVSERLLVDVIAKEVNT